MIVFPCTPLVYFLGALCSFFIYIYILLFTDQKKKLYLYAVMVRMNRTYIDHL